MSDHYRCPECYRDGQKNPTQPLLATHVGGFSIFGKANRGKGRLRLLLSGAGQRRSDHPERAERETAKEPSPDRTALAVSDPRGNTAAHHPQQHHPKQRRIGHDLVLSNLNDRPGSNRTDTRPVLDTVAPRGGCGGSRVKGSSCRSGPWAVMAVLQDRVSDGDQGSSKSRTQPGRAVTSYRM